MDPAIDPREQAPDFRVTPRLVIGLPSCWRAS